MFKISCQYYKYAICVYSRKMEWKNKKRKKIKEKPPFNSLPLQTNTTYVQQNIVINHRNQIISTRQVIFATTKIVLKRKRP